jgi:protein O-GlcNAc transferase
MAVTDSELFQQAFAHEAASRPAAARRLYQQILASIPEHPGALYKLAEHALALRTLPGQIEAQNLLKRALLQAQKQGLDSHTIHALLGDAYLHSAATAAAVPHYQAALAANPNLPSAMINLMIALARLNRNAEALATGANCVSRFPHRVEAWRFYCGIVAETQAPAAQLPILQAAIKAHPSDVSLSLLLAQAELNLNQNTQAISRLNVLPQTAEVLSTLGSAYLLSGQAAMAVSALRKATSMGTPAATVWDNLGQALMQLSIQANLPEAITAFETAVKLDAQLTPAHSNLINAYRYALAWDKADAATSHWLKLSAVGLTDQRFSPFVAMNQFSDGDRVSRITAAWPQANINPLPPIKPVPLEGRQLHIGYLSNDLHEHATLRLIVGLLEQHQCQVSVYSHGPQTASALRARAQAAVPQWHEVAALTDATVAALIRSHGVDVLIDLKGHTQGARLGILANRPAPLQLHYLGYPGSLATSGVDGLVVDQVIAPAAQQAVYRERLLPLPVCYQVNDSARPPPDLNARSRYRAALGVSADTLVLASFNQTYKISASCLNSWLRVLAGNPNTVLWIQANNSPAQTVIRGVAATYGLATHRIIFADNLPNGDHINRLAAADLMLDTFLVGGHTTGSDALWAGVPVLTCLGDYLPARVGASLLQAVDLPEFITESEAAYEAKLNALCRDPEPIYAAQQHLRTKRHQLPLFDTALFTAAFEALLTRELELLAK